MRENRLEVLFRLSRALSGMSGAHQLALAAQQEVASVFGRAVHVYLPHGDLLEPVVSADGGQNAATKPTQDLAVATWAYTHGQVAGMGTDTLPDSRAIFLPMLTPQATVGVLAVELGDAIALSPENRQLLETLATQIGLALERDQLAEQHRSALLEAETERMRSSLLSSVSHDLRTPLAVIAGTSSTLLEMGEEADEPTRAALLGEIYAESNRLTRLVENLLSMTKLEAGVVVLEREWIPVEDVVGSALRRLRGETEGRVVDKHVPADLPLVSMDGVLIEQVLFNLLDNALKYSKDAPLEIAARVESNTLVLEVADRGPGLAAGEIEQVFDKLYRGEAAKQGGRGAGLGLAIARAIVDAHGGRLWAANRTGGGAVFSFSLPLGSAPPLLEDEGEEVT